VSRSPSQLWRFMAFDSLLYWERCINSFTVSEALGESQDTVKKSFQEYRRQYRSGQVIYVSVERVHRPTSTFFPKFARASIQEYVALLGHFKSSSKGLLPMASMAWLDSGPEQLIQPDPITFSALVKAIRFAYPVHIRYASMRVPAGGWRVIHPHALAQSHNRWHCRAYCESATDYRDFNLGRMLDIDREVGPEVRRKCGATDKRWHTRVTIKLGPNPGLERDAQAMIAREYGMNIHATLEIPCRLTMVEYILQAFPVVHPKSSQPELPQVKHLIVVNDKEIERGLF